MVGNNSFSRLSARPKNNGFQALLTNERTQKLELLSHLIVNSRQALVVCGPIGIGKSTLLKALQERKTDAWLPCLMQGHSALSFENIQERAALAIQQHFQSPQAQTLSDGLRLLKSQHKALVLMIDEAGHLATGLIDTLMDYAAHNPVLRVIFALSYDDLAKKNSADTLLDACHLIEIPPLSERHCGEFLQHLAAGRHANGLSDELIAAVYLETEGIPGRIKAKSLDFAGIQHSNNALWVLVAAVIGLVAIALATQWFSATEYNLKGTPSLNKQEQTGPANHKQLAEVL